MYLFVTYTTGLQIRKCSSLNSHRVFKINTQGNYINKNTICSPLILFTTVCMLNIICITHNHFQFWLGDAITKPETLLVVIVEVSALMGICFSPVLIPCERLVYVCASMHVCACRGLQSLRYSDTTCCTITVRVFVHVQA